MAYFARIENGVVKEIVWYELPLADVQARYHPSLTWVAADGNVKEGMAYSNGTYTSNSMSTGGIGITIRVGL